MKIKVKATFEAELEIERMYYPAGATNEEIEKIELENLKNEPHYILEHLTGENYEVKVMEEQ